MSNVPSVHDHISERESDGTWEDCTWDAGLEYYRLAHDKSRPATHTEAQALRAASGEPPTGGSNVGDFRRGVKARYGVSLPLPISGWTALRAALKPNTVALVQGQMDVFGPTHRLSRWQRGFDGGHAVCVLVLADGTLWWCDPLATDTGYRGERVTAAELKAFVTSFTGQHLVSPIKYLDTQEVTVANLVTYLPGYTATVKRQSNVRAEPRIGATKYHTFSADIKVNLVGTVKGDVDPANGSDIWYEFFHDGRSEYTAKDNVKDVQPPAPVDDGFTKATQDAALAAQKATLDAQTKTLIAAAVAAERARIKNILGL